MKSKQKLKIKFLSIIFWECMLHVPLCISFCSWLIFIILLHDRSLNYDSLWGHRSLLVCLYTMCCHQILYVYDFLVAFTNFPCYNSCIRFKIKERKQIYSHPHITWIQQTFSLTHHFQNGGLKLAWTNDVRFRGKLVSSLHTDTQRNIV